MHTIYKNYQRSELSPKNDEITDQMGFFGIGEWYRDKIALK